ncbi:hypothetical protein [[Clostridium] aminophilum]|uniref:Uncharacterized protein n=1 Tax=[Clostridium] aminophilum TaxID=1526 RepID=A0A1I6IDH9_9FIRM|nr:hypothetical protein [[Clostridium] aminophilum]SFR64825.1 hypothetical protein SAMN02910262_00271 [[Clostridium] aminophilum]
MMIVKIIWCIILVYSIAELIAVWAGWFKYLHVGFKEQKLSAGGVAGNYLKLAVKTIIPGIIGMIGAMVVLAK